MVIIVYISFVSMGWLHKTHNQSEFIWKKIESVCIYVIFFFLERESINFHQLLKGYMISKRLRTTVKDIKGWFSHNLKFS